MKQYQVVPMKLKEETASQRRADYLSQLAEELELRLNENSKDGWELVTYLPLPGSRFDFLIVFGKAL